VEPRNPDEVTALNAAPGVVHLVFIDELPFNIIQPQQRPLSAKGGHRRLPKFLGISDERTHHRVV